MARLLPAAYVASVAAVAVARAIASVPAISAVALTPDRLATGRVWLLATSAFVVNGPVLPQLAALAPTTVLAQRRIGARGFVVVALLCHIGATLLTYAVLAAFTGDPDGSRNQGFDYGISAVWLGMLGALCRLHLPAALHSRRRLAGPRLLVGAALVAAALGVVAFGALPAAEHGFAFALGFAAAPLLRARD